MTRRLLPAISAAALLCAALAACGGDDTDAPTAAAPSSAPAATSAAPSPTVDKDRRGCRAVVDLSGDQKFDPTANRDAGALAAEATVAGISQAGVQLVTAANKATADPGPATNLDMAQAQPRSGRGLRGSVRRRPLVSPDARNGPALHQGERGR
ncbi:hypothetical protein [Micromonospora echinospora]|uniref:hypothetical protein n=1 Tax=Micromonospora echinospora TaxID=1877 RepID=UPI003A83BB3F